MARTVALAERASPWLLALLLVLAWDLTTRFGLIDPHDVSRPQDVLVLIWQWTVTGYVFPHLAETVFEVAAGYIAGTLAGLAVAFVFLFHPRIAALFQLPVTLLNALPRAILAPFVVLLLGLNALPKIALVLLVVFIITLINLSAGLREVDRTIVDNARVLGASRRDLISYVYVPAALVWIVGAMRNSIGHAFTAAVVCELVGATSGLGWLIAAGQAAIKPDWVMAGLFFASVIVVFVDLLLLAPLERRGAHWRVF
ncbi:MAG: ABC transporter permease, partial [Nevskiales bacterium]